MKVVQVSFRRFFSCVSFLISFIKNILFRRRQRKSSQTENETLPTSVMVTSGDSAHNQVIKRPCFSIVCYQLVWYLLKHSQTLSWVDERNPTSIFNCVVKKKNTFVACTNCTVTHLCLITINDSLFIIFVTIGLNLVQIGWLVVPLLIDPGLHSFQRGSVIWFNKLLFLWWWFSVEIAVKVGWFRTDFLLMKTNNKTIIALIYCVACLRLSLNAHNQYHQASLQCRCFFAESNLFLYSIFSSSLLCHHVGWILVEGNWTFSSPVGHVFCYWLTHLEVIYSSSQSSCASNIQDEGETSNKIQRVWQFACTTGCPLKVKEKYIRP